jgi:hypothetical protein
MYRKIYGEGKMTPCVICNVVASVFNKDGFPTCVAHVHNPSPIWRCTCGKLLGNPIHGKYGPFFSCCGNLNFNKAMELNTGNEKFKRQRQEDI